jgi:serine/threonine-protein kinase
MRERYRLTRQFAQGGMAEVYLGVATGAEGFEKPVAIKRILPHLASDEKIARMFLSEAKLATFLSHQNIVQVFDVGRGPDGLFIVMELVNGWDLGVVIDAASREKTSIPPALAAFVVCQALAGLCHAYKQTHEGKPILIAHRDVSASNILISAEGEVKMADFGIARLEAPLNRTEPGSFKGKIAYGAPEIFQGQPASRESDQFALGIVLHEMLTGEHPFGRFENSMAYADAIVHRSPAGLPGAPPLLAEIVTKALSKLPQNRFESPEAFARALAQFLASSGTPSTTQELADFVGGLELPRPPLELAGQDTVIREQLPGSFSLKSMPSLQSGRSILTEKDSAFNRPWLVEEMEALQKDWIPLGAQLDISGQLSQPERPPTERAAGAPPANLADPGRLEQSAAAASPTKLAGANFADADGPAQAADAPLELHPKKPTRATEEADIAWAIQKSERSGPGWFKWIAFAVLIASGAAGILKGKEIYSKGFEIYSLFSRRVGLPPLRPPPTALLRIESEPSGAKIEIGSQVLGETPLFVENIYPKSEIEVKLSLKGYRPWTGKFAGGQTAELKARLHPR